MENNEELEIKTVDVYAKRIVTGKSIFSYTFYTFFWMFVLWFISDYLQNIYSESEDLCLFIDYGFQFVILMVFWSWIKAFFSGFSSSSIGKIEDLENKVKEHVKKVNEKD